MPDLGAGAVTRQCRGNWCTTCVGPAATGAGTGADLVPHELRVWCRFRLCCRYVYKGLGSETFEGGAANWRGKLFKWHAAAVKAAGIGSIVRAMSRKTV